MTTEHGADSGAVAPLDALLLKGDADPAMRAIMSTALVLSEEPEFDHLAAVFERASRSVPRMREHVGRSPWSLGLPRWVPDENFDIRDHLRQVGAPGDRSLEAALAMLSSSATVPFDPARPLWDAVLVTGLHDGRAVLALRAHHAIADGVRALQMMANLLDLEPNPRRAKVIPLETLSPRVSGPAVRRLRTVTDTVRVQHNEARANSAAMLRAASTPVKSLASAASYLKSAARAFGSNGATPSVLLRSRSRARRFHTLEFPLDQFRSCARSHSCTVNDVFLTGLLGGLRRYHEAIGAPLTDFPISFPVDVSGDDEQQSGNHFSAAVIPGPSSLADPIERLHAVHELVLSRRSEAALGAPMRVAPLVHQVPSWIAAAGLTAYARRVDLQASNIMGPDCALYLAGAKVDRFFAFGPLPGVPVMAVLVSYDGICTIGFTVDPAAVTDPELFLASTRTAFEELVLPDAATPVDENPPG